MPEIPFRARNGNLRREHKSEPATNIASLGSTPRTYPRLQASIETLSLNGKSRHSGRLPARTTNQSHPPCKTTDTKPAQMNTLAGMRNTGQAFDPSVKTKDRPKPQQSAHPPPRGFDDGVH